MIRVIQVIMIRLQRVLFTALRNYLGLNSELVQNHMRHKKVQSHSSDFAPKSAAGTQTRRQSITSTQSTDLPRIHSLSEVNQPPDMLVDLSTTDGQQIQLPAPQSQPYTHLHSFTSHRRSSITLTDFQINAASSDMSIVLHTAVECLRKELGLPEEDFNMLHPYVELKIYEPDTTLINEGNTDDVCIWFVLTGSLSVFQNTAGSKLGHKSGNSNNQHIHYVHPTEIMGALAVLTGEASAYTIKSVGTSRVAYMTRSSIYQLMRQRPYIVLHLGNGVVRRLSPLVRQCDYALDWIFLESGRAVYRQDEISDSTYIVLSGRLRSVLTQSNGKKEIVGEYGKGDLVGIIEMITETPRTTTVMAVRDSELAKLPEGLFNAIKLRYPVVVTQLISLLSHRILGSMQSRTMGTSAAPLEANPVTHKYSTVALIPINEEVPLTAFTFEVYHSLCALGPTLRLTSDVVRKNLGVQIFEQSNEYRLTSWLAQQEDRNLITLYQCDTTLSAWTQRCMRQADVILIVGLGHSSPSVGKFEREIDRLALRTQKELVLLYMEGETSKPTNTLQWLNIRPWVIKHHHMQCMRRMFTRRSQYRIVSSKTSVVLE